MKRIPRISIVIVLVAVSIMGASSANCQAIDPQKSAKAAAMSDTRFIALSIADNQDALALARKAIDQRTADSRIRELGQQMTEDHSALLYTMQELAAAGGSTPQATESTDNRQQMATNLGNRLSAVSGADFDTVWVTGVLTLQQARYDELVTAKETVMNPQLKAAITEAVPVMRRHCSQLRILQKDLVKMTAQKRKQAALRNAKQ